VLDGLGLEVAYTTIMTILSRLPTKELVERDPRVRAYATRRFVTPRAGRRKPTDAVLHVLPR
jgi:predicted transcriptional regulator